MKRFNLKKAAAVTALGLAIIVGGSESANAQNRNKAVKQRQKIVKQQQKVANQQARLQQQRLRLQQQQRLQNQRQMAQRYRVNRNGSWHNVDNRQADLLRQAVNAGYRQGHAEGQQDSRNRRSLSWNNSNTYRSGSYGYQSYVDRNLYQHYFQQGFQKGYQDGYNSQYRYGSNNNGSLNILGSILGSILNIQQY